MNINTSTKLLLKGNGKTSLDIFDSSYYRKDVSIYGNTILSVAQVKYNNNSIYFDGTGDYIRLDDYDDWYFGTDNFTIDLWIYPTVFASWNNFFCHYASDSNRYYGQLNATGGVVFQAYSGATNVAQYTTADNVLTLNAWNHIAFVRNGTGTDCFRIYVNGTNVTPTSPVVNLGSKTMPNVSGSLYIGQKGNGQNYYQGYIDEFRIVKGEAVWTSDFTPPTDGYQNYISNSGALHFYPSIISIPSKIDGLYFYPQICILPSVITNTVTLKNPIVATEGGSLNCNIQAITITNNATIKEPSVLIITNTNIAATTFNSSVVINSPSIEINKLNNIITLFNRGNSLQGTLTDANININVVPTVFNSNIVFDNPSIIIANAANIQANIINNIIAAYNPIIGTDLNIQYNIINNIVSINVPNVSIDIMINTYKINNSYELLNPGIGIDVNMLAIPINVINNFIIPKVFYDAYFQIYLLDAILNTKQIYDLTIAKKQNFDLTITRTINIKF